MKHQSQFQIKERNRKIAIANIKGLLKENKIKEAVNCASIAGISPEEFGILVRQINN